MLKKKIPVLAFILFTNVKSNCQVAKGDWLVGGSAAFSANRQASQAGNLNSLLVKASLNGGYFVFNRLAVGLKPDYTFVYSKDWLGIQDKSHGWYAGPFVRYYFFPNNQRANLFAEGSYAFGKSSYTYNTNSAVVNHAIRYAFLGGPVIFLNSAVGLEFTVGYSVQQAQTATKDKANVLQTGIGLQFHLSHNKQ